MQATIRVLIAIGVVTFLGLYLYFGSRSEREPASGASVAEESLDSKELSTKVELVLDKQEEMRRDSAQAEGELPINLFVTIYEGVHPVEDAGNWSVGCLLPTASGEAAYQVLNFPGSQWKGELPASGAVTILSVHDEQGPVAFKASVKDLGARVEAQIDVESKQRSRSVVAKDASTGKRIDAFSIQTLDGGQRLSTSRGECVLEGWPMALHLEVAAPGYAPKQYQLSDKSPLRMEAHLQPAGVVAVRARLDEATRDGVLAMRMDNLDDGYLTVAVVNAVGERHIGRLDPLMDRPLMFEGVSVGQCSVELMRSKGGGVPGVLQRVSVTVQQGQVAQATLELLGGGPWSDMVNLDMAVVLPVGSTGDTGGYIRIVDSYQPDSYAGAWGIDKFAISSLQNRGAPNVVGGIIPCRRGSTVRVELGPTYDISEEVRMNEDSSVILECSELSTLLVMVSDVLGEGAAYDVYRTAAVGEPRGKVVPLRSAGTTYMASIPEGNYRLFAVSNSGGYAETEVSAVAGVAHTVELAMDARVPAELHLRLWSVGAEPLQAPEFWADLEIASDQGRVLRKLFGSAGMHLNLDGDSVAIDWTQGKVFLSAPGKYRVSHPWMQNDRSVEVGPGFNRALDLVVGE